MVTLAIPEIRSAITIYFNIFNGIINPNNKVDEIVENNTLDVGARYIKYEDNQSEIQYNPSIIQHLIANQYGGMYCHNVLIHIVLHELNHAVQDLKLQQYLHNESYREYVELFANAQSYRFLINYKEWIKQRTGVEILDEYINSVDISIIKAPIVVETVNFADADISWNIY